LEKASRAAEKDGDEQAWKLRCSGLGYAGSYLKKTLVFLTLVFLTLSTLGRTKQNAAGPCMTLACSISFEAFIDSCID
jgi:hypothetical protein